LIVRHITHHEKSVTQSWLAARVYYRDLMRYTQQYHGRAATVVLWLLSRPLLWGMGIKQWFGRKH
jgi:hypothetical protein